MTIKSDEYYIKNVLDGDILSYKYLVERHKDMAFSVAIKIVGNREDAEEIVQDAFVKVYENLTNFAGRSKFTTWLYKIVFNTAVSRTRKKRLESTELDTFVIENYSEDEIKENISKFDREQQIRLTNKLINELPALEYTLMNLFYREELPVEEISNITGLSVSNVKVKLHRIRKRLYHTLNEMLNKELKKVYL